MSFLEVFNLQYPIMFFSFLLYIVQLFQLMHFKFNDKSVSLKKTSVSFFYFLNLSLYFSKKKKQYVEKNSL